MKKLIEGAWQSYRRYVVPPVAGDEQVKQTRQAFFAGAAILQTLIMRNLSPGKEEITAEDMALMAAIQKELDDFGQQLDVDLMSGGVRQ